MLSHQKKLIEEHYTFLKCRVEENVLICKGIIRSPDFTSEYTVEIRCVYGQEPYSKIIAPSDIKPCIKIHMYDDHSLCLHYPKDMKWNSWTPVYRFTIPWIVEWIHYYELYLINGGIWEGPQSPVHMQESDKNIFQNLADD